MVMKDIIRDFPRHIDDAINIAESISLKSDYSSIDNIVISGQGGSAMGGVMVKNLLSDTLNIPIFINQDYTIPFFVNEKTLFISSSYSGNTEETLSALIEAEAKKSIIFSICSGGKLLKISKQKNFDHAILPSGGAPRAMLCYSLIQMLFLISSVTNLSRETLKLKLLQSKHYLLDKQSSIINQAKKVVEGISNKMPFLYSYSEFEGVVLRFKQQLNENSKRHACYNLIPEMNHNEIVPWIKKNICVIPIFLNGTSSLRNKKRMEITISEIDKSVEEIIELNPGKVSYFEQYFYFIHLVDWVSLFVSEKEDVDPNDISLINTLKEKLKNI